MRERKQRKEKKKIRYAVVGLGYIAQSAILPAFENATENSELTALVSGSPKKLETLSQKYRVTHSYSYEHYADCLKSGQIDAVYIALPNHMHRAYAQSAAEAGIHVLCEKPMALDEIECEGMIGAAEKSGVKLMIAYRLHFERANLQAVDVVNSGRIGEPRIFTSVFSQQVKPGNSRLQKDVGGGAIYDMGVYCINAARYLFRAEPTEVFAWNSTLAGDKRFTEVPEMTTAVMKFPKDRIASFTTGFGATDRSVYEVIGTKGILKMDPAYDIVEILKSEIVVDGQIRKRVFKKRDQFAPELIYFSDCIIRNKKPEPSGVEGLADVRIVRALLESARTNRPVSVSQTKVTKRPDMTQEISKAPVPEAQLLKVSAPGAN